MCGSAAAIPYRTPLILTLIIWSHSSIFKSSSGACGINPALLIITSTRPKVPTAASTSLFTCVGSVTSVVTVSALPPALASVSARALRRSCRRAPSTRIAPLVERSRAVASPSPLLAPVITTILPSMLLLMILTPAYAAIRRGTARRSRVPSSRRPCCRALPQWRCASSLWSVPRRASASRLVRTR